MDVLEKYEFKCLDISAKEALNTFPEQSTLQPKGHVELFFNLPIFFK